MRDIRQSFDIHSGASLFVVCILAAGVIFTHTAPKAAVDTFYYYQLDKILHVLGGWWTVGILMKRVGFRRARVLFVLLFCVAVIWEVFEILVFHDVSLLFHQGNRAWRIDTAGDIAADFLGGAVAFFMFFPQSREKG
jgi:hypothetical protein